MNWRNSIFKKKNKNYFFGKGYHFYAEAGRGVEGVWLRFEMVVCTSVHLHFLFVEELGLTYSQHGHLSRLDRNLLRFSLLRDARSSYALQNNVASLIFASKY